MGDWLLPVMVVGALGVLTLLFALLVGRWIDTQGNAEVGEPQDVRKERQSE